jgi:cytochrome c-type biogenesis protein CcmH/NrfG
MQYRARIARQASHRTRTFAQKVELQKQSEAALRKCLKLDASDARTYVSLGKLLVEQRRYAEARKMYEEGSAATGMHHPPFHHA